MKKAILPLLALFLANSAFCDVTFVNKSNLHSVEVAYRFCHTGDNDKGACGAVQYITVPSASAQDAGIATTKNPSDYDQVRVFSALERNAGGAVVSQGKYGYDDAVWSDCESPLYWWDSSHKTSPNVAVILDDFGHSPIIVCSAKPY